MTTQAERIADLEAVLGRWRCPYCEGRKTYVRRAGGAVEVVPCKSCGGGGLHKLAAAALADKLPADDTAATVKAMRDALIAIALGAHDDAAAIASAVLRDVEGGAKRGR
jgi:hypothetical protein